MIRERTGGWPAATYLAGLAVREHHATKMETVTSGSAAYLSDYLESQVLPSMSSEERSLLTRTSILDRLDGSLCDAVLERSGTGAHLESLARRTLFLAPIDRGHNWFKCHDLLREHLRRQLGSSNPSRSPACIGGPVRGSASAARSRRPWRMRSRAAWSTRPRSSWQGT